MRVELDHQAVVDGEDVYEFHGNTETHYDVRLHGAIVAEVDFHYGLGEPDVSRPTLPSSVLSPVLQAWVEQLRLHRRF